jgi:hypothetical protein
VNISTPIRRPINSNKQYHNIPHSQLNTKLDSQNQKQRLHIFFLPNNIDRSSLTISINNITYTPQSSIRYLRVWLDNNLDCQTHITHRICLARDIIKKLARLTTNGRTLHPHSAIRAIKAAFIPKLLYGIELFLER